MLPNSGLSGLIQLSNTPRPPDSTPDPVLISSSPLPGIDCEKPHDLQSLIAEIQDYKDAAQTILQKLDPKRCYSYRIRQEDIIRDEINLITICSDSRKAQG